MLYPGFLFRSIDMMNLIAEIDFSQKEFVKSYPRYEYIDSNSLIDYCIQCEWISENAERCIKPTLRGEELLRIEDFISCLRLQIKDTLSIFPPTWLNIARRGRNTVKRNMTVNEIQCFQNARLFNTDDLDVIAWWDEIILSSFDIDGKKKHATGRKGELLTCYLEELRTGKKPILHSIDVNTAGYDVLSIISATDRTDLFIEVKSSKLKWKYANFYLTRNEWGLISKNKDSALHLWSFDKELLFARVSYKDIKSHIPLNTGVGKWGNAIIPFSIVVPNRDPFNFPKMDEERLRELLV
jgi:hypothetical protein